MIETKTRARWWWFLAAPLLLLISVACLCVYWWFATRAAWTEVEAETDALDPRWRLVDIEADRKQIRDEENSALYLNTITRKAPSFRLAEAKFYALIFDDLPASSQLNAQQLQLIRAELGKIEDLRTQARRLSEMPYGRFPIVYTDDFLSTLVADQQNARGPADWLQHDAYLLAHEEDFQTAITSCRAIVNVGRSLGDEPFLISALLRYAMQGLAAETLERVLAQGVMDDVTLALMQDSLRREFGNTHFLQGVRGDRAGSVLLLESIRAGTVTFGELAVQPRLRSNRRSPADWWVDFCAEVDYPEHLRAMNRAVEIAKLPMHERHAPFATWGNEVSATRNMVTRVLCPALVKIHQADCRTQAMVRAAVAALACERYRLRNKDGAWPESLDDVAKAGLLDKIPRDPMDDQPLRYRRTNDGIVVYSIGIDMADDQGNIDRKRPQNPGVDVGFRLWDVTARRTAPTPLVEIPKGN